MPTPPQTYILKMSKGGWADRKNIMVSGNYREALFYQEVLEGRFRSLSSLVPTPFYAHGSGIFGHSVMLMADAAQEEGKNYATGVIFFFGNQIWGLPHEIEPRDPLLVLDAMFQRIARVHAEFWRDPKLIDASCLKGAPWYRGEGRGQWESGMSLGGERGWLQRRKQATAR
eukprot:comp162528_c0_seq1/m.49445 comp162528_c0_seq1/g.49445  ORF comp162528_c0_seq1/g.49445 comp162528_c0_seq1/m.49445 type:complete len:171 (-) comp162528_c0_seq1:548-1060(-)